MRVIAGKCRSLKLKAPKGMNTRPTLDRIKETLFNILQSRLPGSVFVDLFSGSGGIGIEALSRGARKAYFVDSNKEAIACINENLHFTRLDKDAVVLGQDVFGALLRISEPHVDIIFIDPPYCEGLEEPLFKALWEQSYIDEDTLIILEADIKRTVVLEGFELLRVKEYKTNKHIFIKRIN